MSRFIIGVIVERTESTELLVEVEAEDIRAARTKAVARAMKLPQQDLLELTRSLDWEADIGTAGVVGASDVEYASKYYEPELPFEEEE